MTENSNIRVHLDYLIPKQSMRYVDNLKKEISDDFNSRQKSNPIQYRDLQSNDWFKSLRKPDFQRETNAWTPKQCVEFLDSVINGRIIPSVILWYSEENGCNYVLDGAHRLSVIRAWMLDDWGDQNSAYYERKEHKDAIRSAAEQTRILVNSKIGSYKSYAEFHKLQMSLSDEGKAPKQEMQPKEYERARFYGRIMFGNLTLSTQWEDGDYERAEQSFLRINRQGQALDPWEATLIEYRKGSYARVVMAIANAGKTGHLLPVDESLTHLKHITEGFPTLCYNIHEKLFVPPYKYPISNLNVPMMISPAYFQKHKYLLELIPLIVNREIALEDDKQIDFLKRDIDKTSEKIIENSHNLATQISDILEHIVSLTNNSKCLAIVPLFYWYNERGQYNRSLLYGFFYWLFSGTDEEISNRKHVFCAYRDKFEYVLYDFKSDISKYLNIGAGAGLKAVRQSANFFQNLLKGLQENPRFELESQEFENVVLASLNSSSKSKNQASRSSRNVTSRDKTQVNIREMFKSSTKCHICGGLLNLGYGGVQYDHVEDYQYVKKTSVDNLDLSHPFCNRNKQKIVEIKNQQNIIALPNLVIKTETKNKIKKDETQQPLPFWGNDDFPN